MDQLTELRPPDFTDVTKWWIFSNKSLLVCLGGGVIAYLLFKITAMIHLAFLGVWLGVMLEVGLFIGVTFPVPDFGSSLLAFGGLDHRLHRRADRADHQPDCASAKPQNLLQRHGMGGRILGGKYQSFYPAYGCVFRADHSGSGNSCHLAYPDEEKELKDKKGRNRRKRAVFPDG